MNGYDVHFTNGGMMIVDANSENEAREFALKEAARQWWGGNSWVDNDRATIESVTLVMDGV